jgi:hypothetical protein
MEIAIDGGDEEEGSSKHSADTFPASQSSETCKNP